MCSLPVSFTDRFMLNVLLSVAQFEREMISGEFVLRG